MNVLNLVELLEIDARVTSMATPLKLAAVGKVAGLGQGSRVIDFGCGRGDALTLWAQCFGIRGVGIDRDQEFCREAVERLARQGVSEQIDIICMDASEYAFEARGYDVAACIGASMIWGGFSPSIRRMREAIHEGGKLVIGEPYYTLSDVPPELVDYEGHWHTEPELYEITREEGFEVGYVARATVDDWDRYASNCVAEVEEIKAARDPEERRRRRERLHRWQDMYIQYRRAFQRWAIYVLYPL